MSFRWSIPKNRWQRTPLMSQKAGHKSPILHDTQTAPLWGHSPCFRKVLEVYHKCPCLFGASQQQKITNHKASGAGAENQPKDTALSHASACGYFLVVQGHSAPCRQGVPLRGSLCINVVTLSLGRETSALLTGASTGF